MKKHDSIQLLSLNLLQPNPFQPRGIVDKEELEELADSIRTYGVLEPLVVAHTPAGYQIVAGERRWRASKIAGMSEVPVIIKETSPKGMLEMALIENVQRVNLNSIERGKAFKQLMRDFNFAVSEIAKRIGKSSSYISNSLKLLDLPDAVKDALASNIITEGHARAIFGIPDQKAMIEVFKQIVKENASVRRAEELARNKKIELGKSVRNAKVPETDVSMVDDQKIKEWQESFKKFFESKSQVKLTRSHKQTRITITLKGDLDETQTDLEKIIGLSQAAEVVEQQES